MNKLDDITETYLKMAAEEIAKSQKTQKKHNIHRTALGIASVVLFYAGVTAALNDIEADTRQIELQQMKYEKVILEKRPAPIHPEWLCTDGLTMTWNGKPVCGAV